MEKYPIENRKLTKCLEEINVKVIRLNEQIEKLIDKETPRHQNRNNSNLEDFVNYSQSQTTASSPQTSQKSASKPHP